MEKYLKIKEKFESQRNEENSISMENYLRNRFKFYGLKTKNRRAVYNDLIKSDKKAGVIDWEFIELCYKDEYREIQYLTLDYLEALQKFLTYEDIPKLEKFARVNQWWDSIDVLDKVIGSIGLEDFRVNEIMLKWSEDEDFWMRRIAINHQRPRKDKTNTELLEKILTNNFGSDEFFINKAIGWSLREYSKTDPEWVRNFLEKYSDKMDKLSIKEANKCI